MEYVKKKNSVSSSSAPQAVTPSLARMPAEQAAFAAEQEARLQRQKEWQAARTLFDFTSGNRRVQRQSVQPVLSAASLYRQEVQQVEGIRPTLQRQVAELQQSHTPAAVQAALQRQQERTAPATILRHPQSQGDWVTVMRQQAEQADGRMMLSRENEQFKALQRQVAQRLAAGYRQDQRSSEVRNAEYAGHLVALQRHPISGHVAQVVLGLIPQGERPKLQRAVDETLQREAEQQAQDAPALHLHALQRQLAELDEQATRPVWSRIQERRGGGNALPEAVQRHLEQGLNHDLSRVRIHDDAEADKLSKSVNAVAFTTGSDIYFQSGKFNPNTQTGLELLAHEVTHTVQQSRGNVPRGIDADVGLEQEARTMGQKLAAPKPPGGQVPARPRRPSAPLTLNHSLQRKAAAPQAPSPNAVMMATLLKDSLDRWAVKKATGTSGANLLLGKEAAADLKLGSSRQLVKSVGFLGGLEYTSLDGQEAKIRPLLQQIKASGISAQVLTAFQSLTGKSLSAVLGEQIRNPQTRQQLLNILPPPISEAQLTQDAFLEQLAVQYVYLNDTAASLNSSTNDGRRGSNPKSILSTFGYRAGPPIAGKWGFQMRVFLPLDPKSGKPPVVAFRGTEGIAFSMKSKPEGTLDSIIGDFAPAGVGYNQYKQNHAMIVKNVQAAATFGKVIMVGHSLGGALAQIAATEFRASTSQVLTFQSAAISQQDVDKMKAYNKANPGAAVSARHYRIDGDVVPNAGQAMLPGEINYFDRTVRPKGGHSYGIDWADLAAKGTLDVSRAQGGHISPMLSTYLRGRGAHNPQQQTLVNSGLHDETTLGKDAKDVQMVYGGQYDTDHDPRIVLEGKRTTTMVGAMNLSGQYETVYYDQIAYNTLLAKIEDMVASGKYKTYAEFRAAAQTAIQDLGHSGRLPLTVQDAGLGEQLKLAKEVKDYAHPMYAGDIGAVYPYKDSPFTEMKQQGVPITEDAARRVRRELPFIWDSWHPEVKQ